MHSVSSKPVKRAIRPYPFSQGFGDQLGYVTLRSKSLKLHQYAALHEVRLGLSKRLNVPRIAVMRLTWVKLPDPRGRSRNATLGMRPLSVWQHWLPFL